MKHFCPGCGVPAKLKDHMDHEDTDTYTASNADIALKSLKKVRKIIEVTREQVANSIPHRVTSYSQKLQAEQAAEPTARRSVLARIKAVLHL